MNKIISINNSNKKNKRFRITMDNGDNFDFGFKTGSTYIDHFDKKKRDNYIKRHIANDIEYNLIIKLIPSPALFSLVILWGPFTKIYDNINYLNKLWDKNSDDFKSYDKLTSGEGVTEFFNEMKGIYDYTDSVKNILNEYGNVSIDRILIFRKPIMSLINIPVKMLNNIPYDKYYHLYIVVSLVNGKRYRIEKNERINITDKISYNKDTKYRIIMNIPDNLTMNSMLDNCRNQMSDEKFFTYHPFNNNCQVFITNLLTASKIEIFGYYGFINQDVQYINKNYRTLGKLSSKLINNFGTVKALFN